MMKNFWHDKIMVLGSPFLVPKVESMFAENGTTFGDWAKWRAGEPAKGRVGERAKGRIGVPPYCGLVVWAQCDGER